MISQYEKTVLFAKWHEDQSTFIIPDPWDMETAKIVENSGFKALATSSAALALSKGVAGLPNGRCQCLVRSRNNLERRHASPAKWG